MRVDLLLSALVSSLPFFVLSAPSGHHVVLEKRDVSSPWMKLSRVPGELYLPVRIALAQSNLDRAEEFLTELYVLTQQGL